MAGNKVYVQGNYVDIHDNKVVNLSIDKVGTVHVQGNVQSTGDIPGKLRCPEAEELMEDLVDAGLLTEEWQPIGLSGSERGLLAKEVVNLSIDKAGTVHVQGNVQPHDDITEVPSVLDTPRARELWQKAIAQGWVDEQLQPLLSRSDAALLAARMGQVLGIEGWKPFEQIWNRRNMRQDYLRGMGKQSASDFLDDLNRTIR